MLRAALRPGPFALLLVCFVVPALAEDRAARASDELERELREMVKLPSATVEVFFDGIDSTRYKLLESSFALDGQPIAPREGTNVLYAGELAPGKHTLTTTLLYEAPAPIHGSVKYKVPGKFIFTAQRGVLMRLRTRIEVDDGAEPSKRLQLMGQAETDLRAKLEEALPPPPERKPAQGADTGDRREEKQVAMAVSQAESAPKLEEPRRRKTSQVQLAAATAPFTGAVQPAVIKRKAVRDRATTNAEKPPVVAPPEEPKVVAAPEEEPKASAADDTRPAPIPAQATAPTPVPSEPQATRGVLETLSDFAGVIAGSALTVIGLLAFVIARKRR